MLSERQKDPQNSQRSISFRTSLSDLQKRKTVRMECETTQRIFDLDFFKGIIESKVYLLKQVKPKWF